MNRYKGFIIFFMTIFAAGFIAFVVIMQHNFMNPEFAATETEEVSTADETQENEMDEEEDVSDEIESEQNSADEEEDQNEEETITYSTKYVNVASLNVRSGPALDDEIIGLLTLDQEVEVEDYNDPDGWVQVTTEEFTGYVNGKYLDDE